MAKATRLPNPLQAVVILQCKALARAIDAMVPIYDRATTELMHALAEYVREKQDDGK